MSDPRGPALYTPRMLALATSLADYPLNPALPLHGEARSRSCGSTLVFTASTDSAGRIARFGLQVQACAVGQAAAALFAAHAAGRSLEEVEAGLADIEAWLAGGPPLGWPGLEVIAPAQAYPARHGAILLAWRAARAALCKADANS